MRGTTLEEVARQQHETGAYGGTYLRMARSTFDVLLVSWPHTPVSNGWSPTDAADAMRAIRIVVDEGLPHLAWRLIDVETKVQVLSGEIERAAA